MRKRRQVVMRVGGILPMSGIERVDASQSLCDDALGVAKVPCWKSGSAKAIQIDVLFRQRLFVRGCIVVAAIRQKNRLETVLRTPKRVLVTCGLRCYLMWWREHLR